MLEQTQLDRYLNCTEYNYAYVGLYMWRRSPVSGGR